MRRAPSPTACRARPGQGRRAAAGGDFLGVQLSGPALVAGDPKASEILRRVTLPRDDDDFMPSDGHNLLTADQIALLTQWITWGAHGPQPAAVPAGKATTQ